MRVNVYAEEITNNVEIIEKTGHYGLRIFLESAKELHNTPNDDDRSAITFWGIRRSTLIIGRALAALCKLYPESKAWFTTYITECDVMGE